MWDGVGEDAMDMVGWVGVVGLASLFVLSCDSGGVGSRPVPAPGMCVGSDCTSAVVLSWRFELSAFGICVVFSCVADE